MKPLNEAILFSVFTRRIKKILGTHTEIRSLLSLWLYILVVYPTLDDTFTLYLKGARYGLRIQEGKSWI